MNTPELIYRARAELAEGPNWYRGALWWVNIVSGTLNRWDPETGRNSERATGGFLSAAAPTRDGKWLIARQSDCALLDWDTGAIEPFAAPADKLPRGHRFNDGKCDPTGRFWVGSMSLKQTPGEGACFCLEPSGDFKRIFTGLTLPNGLAWSPSGEFFYHIDTPTRRITRYPFAAAAGKLGPGELVIQFSDTDGNPDGMTIDAEGNLWVALWSAHCIAHVETRHGRILEKHRVPVPHVTSCTFGGADGQTLYITTAWENMTLDERIAHPMAGCLFALRTTVPGLPVTPFALPV